MTKNKARYHFPSTGLNFQLIPKSSNSSTGEVLWTKSLCLFGTIFLQEVLSAGVPKLSYMNHSWYRSHYKGVLGLTQFRELLVWLVKVKLVFWSWGFQSSRWRLDRFNDIVWTASAVILINCWNNIHTQAGARFSITEKKNFRWTMF